VVARAVSLDRAEIMGRIRAALAGAEPRDVAPPAGIGATGLTSTDALIARFGERVADYGPAQITMVDGRDVAGERIAAILDGAGAGAVAVPSDLDADLVPRDTARRTVFVDPGDTARLAVADAAVTTCTVAVAETGTIVLTAQAGEGRRALSLLPDLHVCVVDATQVVADIPQAFARIGPITRPITMISGPSATSDIELERVEGVHGPRRLAVVLVRTA
jgi:L-lactate dehydrogenase complex protein LldG